MPTRNVALTDHQAALMEKLVSVGRYQNVSEVLREAVRHGVADADARRTRAFDSSADLRRHLTALADAVFGQAEAQP